MAFPPDGAVRVGETSGLDVVYARVAPDAEQGHRGTHPGGQMTPRGPARRCHYWWRAQVTTDTASGAVTFIEVVGGRRRQCVLVFVA